MELVTGPFRPALEDAFAETFARLKSEAPLAPVAVVASSQRLADRLKALALRGLPEGFAAVRFFNLFSFARTLFDEAAAPGSRLLLEDLVPTHLVKAILRRHFSGERYLSRAGAAPGALLSALHELKGAAVKPEHALTLLASQDLGLEDAPKLAEILSLYKRYADELRRRRLHVRPDVVRIAAEAAPRSPYLGTLSRVLYYGCYDLDQNQLDLLREVKRRVPTTFFFPYADRPEYAYAEEFLKTVVAPMARETRPLRSRPSGPRVTQIAASGAHDEVWAAAKEVLRLADSGVPLSEIGVVARTLDPYADLVESVFREHRIPYVTNARRKLDRDPRVKAARLLFSIDDFNRADVLDLLRSPNFRLPGGDPQLWDLASRFMGIGRGADEWRRRLGGAAGKDYVYNPGARAGEKAFVLARTEIDSFWTAVRGLLEAPPPPSVSWADYAAWAVDRHHAFLEPEPRVERAIASLADLEGLALEDPREALLDRLAELSEPAGGPAGVHVLDAMAARGLSFRAVILLGMNERVFPRFILEDPFLRDSVRSRLEHRLGCRMSRKVRGYEEERLLFELLMSSADEIVLCHQRSDEKGRLQIRSAFLPPGDPVPVPRRPAERLRACSLALLTPREASLRTAEGEALGRAIGWDVDTLLNALSFVKEIEARGSLTKFDGLVDARSYWNSVASFGFSPTALEKLAECPFRFFAARMLDLEALPEPEEESSVTAQEAGALYHDVLERFHRDGDLDLRIEEGFRRFEASRSIRYPVLWDVEKDRLRRVLRAFVAADDVSFYKPRDFEVELRGEIPLEVGGRRSVTFRGFADRLDVGPGGAFRVVDYKRSRSRYRWKMETGVFEKGKYLQAPLYFLLAERLLGKTDRSRSKFVYYFVEEALEGGDVALELEGEAWERLPEFEALLKGLLEQIPRGRFPIRPDDHCRYCDFHAMCRKTHLPSRWRAEET